MARRSSVALHVLKPSEKAARLFYLLFPSSAGTGKPHKNFPRSLRFLPSQGSSKRFPQPCGSRSATCFLSLWRLGDWNIRKPSRDLNQTTLGVCQGKLTRPFPHVANTTLGSFVKKLWKLSGLILTINLCSNYLLRYLFPTLNHFPSQNTH